MFKDSYFQSSEIRQNAVKSIDYVELFRIKILSDQWREIVVMLMNNLMRTMLRRCLNIRTAENC